MGNPSFGLRLRAASLSAVGLVAFSFPAVAASTAPAPDAAPEATPDAAAPDAAAPDAAPEVAPDAAPEAAVPEVAPDTAAPEAAPDVGEPSASTPASEATPPAVGSQHDDRGPIEKGFGKRWIATPTISSNPKLSTSFGATGIVFLRFDDSIASTLAIGGAYSVTNSWTAFLFGKFNFLHDRERAVVGIFRGHAANSYSDFMDQGIALESTSNVFATPMAYFHRLGERTKTDWWLGGQFMYLRLDQSGNDPTSSEIISNLDLDGSDAYAFGPNVLLDSRDNVNSPTTGQHLLVRGNMWGEPNPTDGTPIFWSLNGSYSYYFPLKYFVLALEASARFSFDAPLIFQSSLSRFRAYTVGEQIAQHTMSIQAETRIPFGHSRFGAALFGGVATLFNDFSDWGKAETYYPMGGGGFRFVMSPKQQAIIRLEYAQGIGDARGIYLAMGQAFN